MELFAALVVSLILTLVAIAGYRVYQRQMPVKYTAQRLVHSFSAARAFAIAHNDIFCVQYDPVRRNFWIDQTDETGLPVVAKVVRPEVIDEKVAVDGLQFAQGPQVQSGPAIPIRFFPDGSSDDVRIYLRMKADDPATSESIYTVRLYGPTGQSRLFERRRLAP